MKRFFITALAVLFVLFALFGCTGDPDLPNEQADPTKEVLASEAVITNEPAVQPTDEPTFIPTEIITEAPTPEPTPAMLPEITPDMRERILNGEVIALNGGKPITPDWNGGCIDIDGDGVIDEFRIVSTDDFFDGSWELYIGKYLLFFTTPYLSPEDSRVWLASLDGETVSVLINRTDGMPFPRYSHEVTPCFTVSYFTPIGKMYRLGYMPGDPAEFALCDTWEEYIANGMQIILASALNSGAMELLDIDADGIDEQIAVEIDAEGYLEAFLINGNTVNEINYGSAELFIIPTDDSQMAIVQLIDDATTLYIYWNGGNVTAEYIRHPEGDCSDNH